MAQSLDSAASPLDESAPRTDPDWLTVLWRALLHPLAWSVPVGVLVVLGLAALLLPQMPGQLNQEPVTAARWLSAQVSDGGLALWRTLGLYNILYHPLLRIAPAFLAFVISIRLAHTIAGWRAMRRWLAQARTIPTEPGTALALDAGAALRRRRRNLDGPPEQTADWLSPVIAQLTQSPYSVEHLKRTPSHATASLAARDTPSDTHADDTHADDTHADDTHASGSPETRIVIARGVSAQLGRILAQSSLLLATLAFWGCIVFGWNVTTPILAPGDSFQSLEYGMEVHYALPGGDNGAEIVPSLTLRAETIGEATLPPLNMRRFLIGQMIQSRVAAPGLVLSVDDDRTPLRQLIQTDNSTAVGLVLDTPNGEETVLLPEIAAGLRIVRRPGGSTPWLVEYYGAGDAEPQARWDIDPTQPTTLELPAPSGSPPLLVQVRPAAGMTVALSHLPGYWLTVFGLGLAVIGFVWGRRPPFFALIQIAPWHRATAFIVQTTSLAEFRQLGFLAAIPAQESTGKSSQPASPTSADTKAGTQ